jgi:hypothetical protein
MYLVSVICRHAHTYAHAVMHFSREPSTTTDFFPIESISRYGLFYRKGFKEQNLSNATRQFSLNVIIIIHSVATSRSWNSLFKQIKIFSFLGQKESGVLLSLVGNIQLENMHQIITMQWHFKLNICNIFQCCHYSNEVLLLMYLILSKMPKFVTTQKIICGQP